ncbi:GntR family transcriptional regulator [Lichenihabitans sp. Uapishka_5]|uniref:GntR family transcriptional regulator n=1 Tax=Lichenihabitans sp. Uapishka_5 TaxID=3037302 RepID=UPI0029E81497|nr:GntR family transcriptional regulator [Lichenihabitans sp. Uapishka_5]MDX7951477.1 GntR family transcriptional regulator [Lichenihabitans sp. Uapishka_5]
MEDIALALKPRPVDQRLPKATQVYEVIRSAIISMELPPGASVPEKAICNQLDVSRTPFREAILQLATEDLVTIKPGEGTFVNRIHLREVLDGQIVRDAVEPRLVRLAARRFQPKFASAFDLSLFKQRSAAERRDFDEFFDLDNEFHRLIGDCSEFPNVWRTIHMATGQLDRVRRIAFPIEDNFGEVIGEHSRIADCIKAGDEDGAAAVLQAQLDSIFKTIEIIKEADPTIISAEQNATLDMIR